MLYDSSLSSVYPSSLSSFYRSFLPSFNFSYFFHSLFPVFASNSRTAIDNGLRHTG
jgi:hypothetical protein